MASGEQPEEVEQNKQQSLTIWFVDSHAKCNLQSMKP